LRSRNRCGPWNIEVRFDREIMSPLLVGHMTADGWTTAERLAYGGHADLAVAEDMSLAEGASTERRARRFQDGEAA
jgi:hypothetical protein